MTGLLPMNTVVTQILSGGILYRNDFMKENMEIKGWKKFLKNFCKESVRFKP